MSDIQLDDAGRLRHLITTEGLSADLITRILDTAESFVPEIGAPAKKVPLLRGRTVFNLFFENSTRTRITFPPHAICMKKPARPPPLAGR